MDAAAEWGMQAQEYQIVTAAWGEFRRQLYAVGQDRASAQAYGVISQGCRSLPYQYQAGHLPPG